MSSPAEISDENDKFDIHTANGNFSFTPKDVPYGEGQTFLEGRVAVDRVPPSVQLTPSQEDEDFPAIAQSGDDIWATYIQFTHADRDLEYEIPQQTLPKAPDDFKFLGTTRWRRPGAAPALLQDVQHLGGAHCRLR